MSEIILDSRVKHAGKLAKEAFAYLNQLQQGEKQLIKTGQEFIDCHLLGLLPGDCIIYAANSGVGKTKLLYDTLDLVLDEKINPCAKNIKSLEYSLEMRFLNRILRDSNKITKKKKSDILTKEFTDEEKELIRRYYNQLQDDRRYVVEESVTTKEFYTITRDFCILNKEADGIFISIDHVLLLTKEGSNEDPFEMLTMYINNLRKEFNNVYFILLSQFNRTSLATIKDRDNAMVPTTGMIYGSSHFEFLSSYIVALVDPFKFGVNEFLKVNKERYDWLEQYMTDEDNKGKVSFHTMKNMFVFTLKTRESDEPYKNLHIIEKELTNEQLEKMKQSVEEKPTIQTPNFPVIQIPKFEQTISEPVKPNYDMAAAFGSVDNQKVNDEPF